jgi:hypothetical protein
MTTRLAALFLAAITLTACQGPDPVRLRNERAAHTAAVRCADGWFQGLPWTPHDELMMRQGLADWERAITADEALLGWVVAR